MYKLDIWKKYIYVHYSNIWSCMTTCQKRQIGYGITTGSQASSSLGASLTLKRLKMYIYTHMTDHGYEAASVQETGNRKD